MKRFQFSIHDLFWLTLVVGLILGLWQARNEIAALQSRVSWLEAGTKALEFDNQFYKAKLSNGATPYPPGANTNP